MPPAARVGDMHQCPVASHVGGAISTGSGTVRIGGQPAARVGDLAVCVGPVDAIANGSSTVLIEHRPAARLGDPCAHGGAVIAGCPTVFIDLTGQGAVLAAAAQSGTPFCEKCGG